MSSLKVWGGLIALGVILLYIAYNEGYIGKGTTTATPATGSNATA